MEQNQNRNCYRDIFDSIFSLICRSSVFQIISWNWKDWSNQKVEAKKVFWHAILHLCNALHNFFIKIGSNWCFFKIFSEIESTWLINSSKEETILPRDCICATFCWSFWSTSKVRAYAMSKKWHHSWLYYTALWLDCQKQPPEVFF